ncbi:hypothetical protein [Candidatus Enterococcus courvalinii]|uniref:Lipoprotein n=1 Tax=Candidatus Enterococcus courvalinii TaxID=2815329 RepID=A0ABS3HYS3_9ENTE|nr:hypothetical protein [Enterococcus sp. MSG2901]MBO0481230.1 hypothetical protein [Enterococcus sp. MSG2901]
MKKKNGITWLFWGIGMILFFQSIINMEVTASITLGTLLFTLVGWQLKQMQRGQRKKWLLPILFSLSLILGACGTGSAVTTETTSSSTHITKSSKTSESSTKDTTEISKEKAKKKELENLTKHAQQEVEKAEKEPTRDQLKVALAAIERIPGGSSTLTERANKVEQTIVTTEKKAEEEKRVAEEKAAEAKRVAEEQRVAEEKAAAEAKRVAEEQAAAEAKRVADEQAAAEAKRIADEQAEQARIAEEQAAAAQAAAQQNQNQQMVYIAPDSGRKYHYDPNCRGLNNANSVVSIPLSEAQGSYGLCGFED